MKHWLTTIFGSILGLATLAHASGITIGHVGSTDVIGLIAAVGAAALGAVAADARKNP